MFRPRRPSRFQAARFETELARRESRPSLVTPVAVESLTESQDDLPTLPADDFEEDFPSEAAMLEDAGRISGVRPVAAADSEEGEQPAVRVVRCVHVA